MLNTFLDALKVLRPRLPLLCSKALKQKWIFTGCYNGYSPKLQLADIHKKPILKKELETLEILGLFDC